MMTGNVTLDQAILIGYNLATNVWGKDISEEDYEELFLEEMKKEQITPSEPKGNITFLTIEQQAEYCKRMKSPHSQLD